MGPCLSRWSIHSSSIFLGAAFFGSTRAASILPSRPFVRFAAARSGRQGWRFLQRRRRLVLDGREHGGALLYIGLRLD